jgi:putative flippase GtrA
MLKQSAGEFGRYFLVQVAAYAVEWAAFLGLRYGGVDLLPANVLAKVAALCFAFVCHRIFTFRAQQGHVVWQAARYLSAFVVTTTLSTWLLWLLHAWLPEWLAKGVSDAVIIFFSFFVAKLLVFSAAKPKSPAAGSGG